MNMRVRKLTRRFRMRMLLLRKKRWRPLLATKSVAIKTPDVDPDLGAVIVNRAVYDSLVTRAASLKSSEVVDRVLGRSHLSRFRRALSRALSVPACLERVSNTPTPGRSYFVPDDGRSPVHRILFDKEGAIVGRVGP